LKNGDTDSSRPKTYGLIKRLTVNKKSKANHYEHNEHLKNLASLQKRLNNVGSKDDRKKNPHDPLSNPVFFFNKGNKPGN